MKLEMTSTFIMAEIKIACKMRRSFTHVFKCISAKIAGRIILSEQNLKRVSIPNEIFIRRDLSTSSQSPMCKHELGLKCRSGLKLRGESQFANNLSAIVNVDFIPSFEFI